MSHKEPVRVDYLLLYKVYINSLLVELTQHSFAISINLLSVPCHCFADDISFLVTYPTFLNTFMNHCYEYSIKWRYEFHNDGNGIVTLKKQNESIVNLLNNAIGCLVTKLLTNVMSTKTLG